MNILNWKRKLNTPLRNFRSSLKVPILKIKLKKGKFIDLQEQSHDLWSEHLRQNRISKELELVIFGDCITKYIIPENICKCDPQHAVNLSKSGAKVKGIYKQLSLFQEGYEDTRVKNIIIHVGTNHLTRDNPEDTAKNICNLLVRIQYQFADTVIFYSGIPPKFGKKSFGDINYIKVGLSPSKKNYFYLLQ